MLSLIVTFAVCSVLGVPAEEAATRLVQRENRINLDVERSCKALAEERDERVGGVAAVKVSASWFFLRWCRRRCLRVWLVAFLGVAGGCPVFSRCLASVRSQRRQTEFGICDGILGGEAAAFEFHSTLFLIVVKREEIEIELTGPPRRACGFSPRNVWSWKWCLRCSPHVLNWGVVGGA